MITDHQLAEWERLANEATPGPWLSTGRNAIYANWEAAKRVCVAVVNADLARSREPAQWLADAAFIRQSREIVPQLVAALREARAESEKLSMDGWRAALAKLRWEKLERLEVENALLQAVADAAERIDFDELPLDWLGTGSSCKWAAEQEREFQSSVVEPLRAALVKLREHREKSDG